MGDRTGDLEHSFLGERVGAIAALTPRTTPDGALASLPWPPGSPDDGDLFVISQVTTTIPCMLSGHVSGAYAVVMKPGGGGNLPFTLVKPGAITSMPSKKSSSTSQGDTSFWCDARCAGARAALCAMCRVGSGCCLTTDVNTPRPPLVQRFFTGYM